MNDQQHTTQRTLFAPQLPTWAALPLEAQRALLDALSPMLLQAVAPESETNTQPKSEQGAPHEQQT